MKNNERFIKILIDCLTKEKIPTIEEWSFTLNTSRPTIISSVKEVKKWLDERELVLEGKPGKGYRLIGEEEKIRNAIIDIILQENIKKGQRYSLLKKILNKNTKRINTSSYILSHTINGINLITIRKIVDEIMDKLKTKLIDIDYLKFILAIAISIKRIKEKHFLFMNPKKLLNIMQAPEYTIIYNKLKSIEKAYKIQFSPEEIGYITIQFIISRVQKLSSFKEENKDIHIKYAKEIAKIVEEIFDLPITGDQDFIKMLALHLKSTLEKVKYKIRIENPILNEIKYEYPLPFSIAEHIALILREKGLIIPKEEVGYIAMYIAMAIEKIRYKRRQRKKVAIVCTMAIGTSGLLFWRLLNEFPELNVVQIGSYEDIINKKMEEDLDLIISTIPLPDLSIPHIVVSPFLNQEEQNRIRKTLGITRKSYIYNNSKDQIIDENLIIPNLEADTWKKVIKILGEVLYVHGYVKKEYVEATISREKALPTGLETETPIAIPHAEATYTIKEGIAIATLKNPVEFYAMGDPKKILKVKIVIMPALSSNTEKNAIFYEILKGLKNTELTKKIIGCKTAYEIKTLLVKYIYR